MKLKHFYVIYENFGVGLPVATFDSINSISLFFNLPVRYIRKACRENYSLGFKSKYYKIYNVLVDIDADDDEISDADFTVTAEYNHGNFYQDYRTFEEAKQCAFLLIKKRCGNVEIYQKSTGLLRFSFGVEFNEIILLK